MEAAARRGRFFDVLKGASLLVARSAWTAARASIIASQTSGTIVDCFDTRKRYFKLVNESPVARNLNVMANLSLTVIAYLIYVALFSTFEEINEAKYSNSVIDMRVKFLTVSSTDSNAISCSSLFPYCNLFFFFILGIFL
jgi:hypothetical protein